MKLLLAFMEFVKLVVMITNRMNGPNLIVTYPLV